MFGDRLRELRENKHLKQNELAKKLGIGRTTLSNYELNNRQPDFDTLEKIADYFKVTIDYLVGRTNVKTFDEYVLNSDLESLSKQYKKADLRTKEITTNTIDHIYLSILDCIRNNNTELLSIFEKMYYCIYRLNTELDSRKKALLLNKMVEFDITTVHDKFKILAKYKNKLNSLLDELFQYYMSKQDID